MARKINKGTQAKIVTHIKDGIISERYKPSQELPKRSHFIEKYNTTPITVQRAFNHLIKNGFVRTEARLGTFVADRPPNIYRYALVFARDRKHSDWTRFWQLMIDNKSIVEKNLNIDIETYEGLEYEDKSADYLRFIEDKKAGAFAGVIVTSELYNFEEELFSNLNVPCVAISHRREVETIDNFKIDKESFHKLLAEKAAGLDCKRISVIATDHYKSERENSVRKYFEENSLPYYEDYVQYFSVKEPFWAERYVSLLLKMSDNFKPDCFIIIDDNFLPFVFNELNMQGRVPGKDIHVVSHANFPIDEEKYPGVNFVGYDVIDLLHKTVSALQSEKTENRETLVEAVMLEQIRG